MSRYVIWILFGLFLFGGTVEAQRWKKTRREVCVGFGGSAFLGELGGPEGAGSNSIKDWDPQSLREGLSVGFFYRLTESLALKTSLYHVMVQGNDMHSGDTFRQMRNIHFKSRIIELSTQFEFILYQKKRGGHRYKFRGVRGHSTFDYSVYVFGGVGGFYFDPKAEYLDNTWHRLKPFGTEGQNFIPSREPYSNFQLVLPFGVGMKYQIGRSFAFSIEYGYRKSFTDYIDDVSRTYVDRNIIRKEHGNIAAYLADPSYYPTASASASGEQRGDPSDKDAMMYTFLTVYYKLKRTHYAIPKF